MLNGSESVVVKSELMRSLNILFPLMMLLASCNLLPESWDPATLPPPSPTTQVTVPVAPTDIPPSPTLILITPSPAATVVQMQPTTTVTPPLPNPLSDGEARAATARELIEEVPPVRDDVRLAVAYLGASPIAATPEPLVDLVVGDRESFFIGNVDSNTVSQIEAELMSVGENAYFWFDLGRGSIEPDVDLLAEETATFDQIYDTLYNYFGVTEPAGGRVHIVHASPNALCDIPNSCRLAGYFSSRDMLPRSINPQSNERAMFVMNTQQFGSGNYLDVLAHELRHMLGNGYDAGEEDWFVEGGALLAEDLVGYPMIPRERGNLFLRNPDQQLNSWTDEDTIPYYGQGYLLNRYLYDRLGEALFREFLFSQKPGLQGIDAVAQANGLDINGKDLWLDWLATMALHDVSEVDERFRWAGPDLGPIATTAVNTLPASFDTTVNQFAADYYELPSSGEFVIDFSGAPIIPLLSTVKEPDGFIWYAQRANDSNPRLTRTIDLRNITSATLHYRVYIDIEHGYDFAYVSVSDDGGQTWQPIVAPGMQGEEPQDDPSDSALAERFYTGQLGQWIEETGDLSAYAGKEILLRFEYVTDPILTYGGFAVDDISIPEIGLFDGVESLDEGWTAEGFTRATTDLPQEWWLLLISFDSDGRASVEQILVPPDGQHTLSYKSVAGTRRPILIVSANAPETMRHAFYSLDIRSQ